MTDMTEDILNEDLDLTEEDVHGRTLFKIETRVVLQKTPATRIRTLGDAVEYLCREVSTLTHEEVYAIFLDMSKAVVGFSQVGQGTLDWSGMSKAKILQCALLTNAKSVILIHNHPSLDTACPSYVDTMTARAMQALLHEVDDMVLYDFIITTPLASDKKVYSMRADGILKGNPCRGVDTESEEYKAHQEYMKEFLSSKKAD